MADCLFFTLYGAELKSFDPNSSPQENLDFLSLPPVLDPN